MNISIKRRIYLSFLLLVGLFVINGAITNITLRNNARLSERLSNNVDPSLQALDEFKKMMLESKMYTTNWVFLRYKQEDKDHLQMIHTRDYAPLKARMAELSAHWEGRKLADSLNNVFKGFEKLLGMEKQIMTSLDHFIDYDDPVLKLEAERQVEEEILPRTDELMTCLDIISDQVMNVRTTENAKLEKSASNLKMIITIMAIAILFIGLLLSVYLARVIIAPVKQINRMINDLGRGVLRKINHNSNGDEIGHMVCSVNSLSDSLQATATFAHEVGLRNFDMPFTPLSDDDTLGKALLTMRDNLKISATDLEVQNKELERKNRELEQFAYVASHDLQEPLRTTASFVELLQTQYKGRFDEKADKYLEYVAASSERMKVLISDLLEYSRIGNKQQQQVVDCNMILHKVLSDIDGAVKNSGIDISASTLPTMNCYPTEIKQLFQHLLTNAIKFRKQNTHARAIISASKKGANWEFSFSDNGIGISKEHYERIFIIFQRLHTRSQYNGSGIGLSHCKKIVELHKGKIWLESELGMGTTFFFTIPQNK